jgi:hypothetical protein
MVAEGAVRERPVIRQDRETPDRIIGLRQFVGIDRLPARGFASGNLRKAAGKTSRSVAHWSGEPKMQARHDRRPHLRT